jgi:hypothetical protein
MMGEKETEQTPKLFVACLDFVAVDSDEEGTFQLVLEAQSVDEAVERCRSRLTEIATTTDKLGLIHVYLTSLLELSRQNLGKGIFVNYSSTTASGGFTDSLPLRGAKGDEAHFPCDPPAPIPPEQVVEVPIFWSGVDIYEAKWKLYWCETDDHDEDWFVIAREEVEAQLYFEDDEGYEEDAATAELVCVLPFAEQLAPGSAACWPTDENLIACGAEFLPYTPQDGGDELRQRLGSGGRVVRLGGRIYTEGDVVSNMLHREGVTPSS